MLTVAISRSKILRTAVTDQAEKSQLFPSGFIESQNSWAWKGPLEVIQSNHFLKEGLISKLDKATQGLVQFSLENVQRRTFHNLSGHLFQHLTSLCGFFSLLPSQSFLSCNLWPLPFILLLCISEKSATSSLLPPLRTTITSISGFSSLDQTNLCPSAPSSTRFSVPQPS